MWQLLKAREPDRTECVARILPLGDRRDFESRRKFGGQILQRMHGEIDAACGEGFFNFFREHPLRADHRERNVSDLVAGGMNNFNFHFMSARTK